MSDTREESETTVQREKCERCGEMVPLDRLDSYAVTTDRDTGCGVTAGLCDGCADEEGLA